MHKVCTKAILLGERSVRIRKVDGSTPFESIKRRNGGAFMLHLSSGMTTLPMMLIGMVGILLVIGVIVLAVMLLNRLTSRK